MLKPMLVILILAGAVHAAPKLAISEIMYDPTSPESDDQQTDSVAIRDAKKNVIDEVIWSNDSPWPITRNGGSIQFICPAGADPQAANDEGKNWVASGASNSHEFKGHGRGTPGGPPKVATTQI